MLISLAAFYVSLFIAHAEPKIGDCVVFDHNGQRQMAVIGTKPKSSDGVTNFVATWNTVTSSGAKGTELQKLKWSSQDKRTLIDVPSLKHSIDGVSVDLKKDMMVLGTDNKPYRLAAVFPNGELALAPFEFEYGKIAEKKTTVVQNVSFLKAYGKTCTGGVLCTGAQVQISDGVKMCSVQNPKYLKQFSIRENSFKSVQCVRNTITTNGTVDYVFSNGDIVVNGQVLKTNNAYPDITPDPVSDPGIAI